MKKKLHNKINKILTYPEFHLFPYHVEVETDYS